VKTQATDPVKPGYVPHSVLDTFNNGWKKRLIIPPGVPVFGPQSGSEVTKRTDHKFRSKSTMIYCQRCFRIQNYRVDDTKLKLDEENKTETSTSSSSLASAAFMVEKIVTQVPSNGVVIKTVDILDFESSIVPELLEAFSRRGIPVIVILTKMDCLPISDSKWSEIVSWVEKTSLLLRKCRGNDGKLNVIPVSSVSDSGFERLESRLSQYLSSKDLRPIYVVGRENSGKSSFLNRYLRYIGYKHLGCVHYKRGVGGITRSPFPGTTMDFIRIPISDKLDIFDSPGIPATGAIQEHLKLSQDFRDVSPGHSLQPTSLTIKEGKSLLIGALGRIEVAKGSSAMISSFVSPKVTIHLVNQSRVLEFLKRKAGTFLYPPHGSPDSEEVHPIMKEDWVLHKIETYCGPSLSRDDIVISGLGWFSVYGNGRKTIHVWVSPGVKVFRRPAMIPSFIQWFGTRPFHHRMQARGLTVNKRKKELVKSLRELKHKDHWRETSREQFELTARPPASLTSGEFITEETESLYRIDRNS
jgi:ribosome biogenesis GTPase A